jgi:hypothetical protein
MKRLFFLSAAVLLSTTAVGKLVTVASGIPVLELPDPFFVVTNRTILLSVAITELVIVFLLLVSRESWMKGLSCAWLGSNFLLYRTGVWLLEGAQPCPCLGALGPKLGLKAAEVEFLLKLGAVYLLVAGLALALLEAFGSKSSRRAVEEPMAPAKCIAK